MSAISAGVLLTGLPVDPKLFSPFAVGDVVYKMGSTQRGVIVPPHQENPRLALVKFNRNSTIVAVRVSDLLPAHASIGAIR